MTIAFWVLGIFAAAQVLAVAWKVVPDLIIRIPSASADGKEMEALREEATEGIRLATEPYRPQPESPATANPGPEEMQRAMSLVAEADKASRVGDWEAALKSISSAREILPDNPRLLLQNAFVIERLGKVDDARLILLELLKRPDLDPETRTEATRLDDWISQTIDNMDAAGVRRTPTASAVATQFLTDSEAGQQGPVLEETGLQPGASLGIVDVREIQSDDSFKTLRVAIKARPGSRIDASEAKVIVRIFEINSDGEIFLTESSVSSEWFSPPVDWADNEPEILDVKYPLSDDAERSFHGYTVAIYFRDELQDSRAVPGGLDRQFPPDLFLEKLSP